MNANELVGQYLNEKYTVQLATVASDQPWICTVYFVADDQLNLYWASLPSRRHSQEIKAVSNVAAAIVVQNVIGQPAIGIQAEGVAKELSPEAYDARVVEAYAEKFKRDKQWQDDFISGRTEHRLYQFTPSSLFLFDEVNFPGGQRQPIDIK